MPIQARGDPETHQHRQRRRQEDGRIAEAARDIAGHGPGHAQRQIQEGRVGAPRPGCPPAPWPPPPPRSPETPARSRNRSTRRPSRPGRRSAPAQQRQPGGFDQERNLCHPEAAVTRDRAGEQQPHADKRAAEGAERVGRALPRAAGVVQRHEGRQRAEAHRAQPSAMPCGNTRSTTLLNAMRCPPTTATAFRASAVPGPPVPAAAPRRPARPCSIPFQVHAQRRAQRQAAIGADAVPGNHPRGVAARRARWPRWPRPCRPSSRRNPAPTGWR